MQSSNFNVPQIKVKIVVSISNFHRDGGLVRNKFSNIQRIQVYAKHFFIRVHVVYVSGPDLFYQFLEDFVDPSIISMCPRWQMTSPIAGDLFFIFWAPKYAVN